LQPALFPIHPKQETKSCCKKGDKKGGCGKEGKDCCSSDQCNPFFSQCPLCAANALVMTKYTVPERVEHWYPREKFMVTHDNVISNYIADIPHPPQAGLA